jgi:hypothetical protein
LFEIEEAPAKAPAKVQMLFCDFLPFAFFPFLPSSFVSTQPNRSHFQPLVDHPILNHGQQPILFPTQPVLQGSKGIDSLHALSSSEEGCTSPSHSWNLIFGPNNIYISANKLEERNANDVV